MYFLFSYNIVATCDVRISRQSVVCFPSKLHLATQEMGICCTLHSGKHTYLQFITVAAHHSAQEEMSSMIKSADYSIFHYCARPFLPRFSFPTSPLYPHSPFHSLFLFFFFLPLSELPPLSIFLCQYADRVWGLGKERDIKSGLWLCTRL